MIQLRTMVTVADNSGAKRAQCIKVLGGHHSATAAWATSWWWRSKMPSRAGVRKATSCGRGAREEGRPPHGVLHPLRRERRRTINDDKQRAAWIFGPRAGAARARLD